MMNKKSDDVELKIGKMVRYGQDIYRISHISVIGINIESGANVSLPVGDLLSPATLISSKHQNDMSKDVVGEKAWQEAERRYLVIESLVLAPPGRDVVEKHARAATVSIATIYRWITRFKSGGISALVPGKRGWIKGKGRGVAGKKLKSQRKN